jgi:putative transposase
MTQPNSEGVSERALLCAAAGETIREIAATLQISSSCVSKGRKLRREPGALRPGQVGGHTKRVLSGERAEWLRARIASGTFTSRGLAAEFAARGIKTDRQAVWMFLRAEGLSFKKNRAPGGTVTSGCRPQTGALESATAQD